MFFHPLGRIAIFSSFNNAIKITNTFSDGRIVDFTFTHVARGDRKLQIPYYTLNMRAIYAPAESGTRKSLFWTRFPPLPPLTWVMGDFNLAVHKKDRSARTSSDNPGMVNDILEHHLDTHYLLSKRQPKPTYHHPSTSSQRSSRIDYIFAPDSQLKPGAKFRLEGPGLLSDHSILVLDNLETKRKSAPQWRMNIRTLHDKKVNEDIGKLIMD
ncbi:MAG: endonuclease/exonuclease/phosphatase family protein [Thaumarchaeota archaeon]|nr:MAG: endonuclease/exonuclease/phosphatase family protein [Nitrososphaerota archaeon]